MKDDNEEREMDFRSIDSLNKKDWDEIMSHSTMIKNQNKKKPYYRCIIEGFIQWLLDHNTFIYADDDEMNADSKGKLVH